MTTPHTKGAAAVDDTLPIRVLVVDHKESRRAVTAENLRQHGMQPFLAEGAGDMLLADAVKRNRDNRCQVAVVNPRLLNPADPEDFSGLGLAQRLAPAGVVIYTAEADVQIAYRAGRGEMGLIFHNQPLDDLLAAIREQARQRKMEIIWPLPDFNRMVADAMKFGEDQVTLDHLKMLLGELFPQATQLTLETLSTLQTSYRAATPVRRAVVLRATERRAYTNSIMNPKVVKVGTKARVQQEVENYHKFVDGRLRHDRQARMEKHALVWHLGAIAYTFVGVDPGEMMPFRRYYTHHTAGEVTGALAKLFLQICQPWFKDEQQHEAASPLYAHYQGPMNMDKHLARLNHPGERLHFDDLPGDLPNPGHYMQVEGTSRVFERVTTSIIHGDLHADNFFIDRAGLAWLIDFEQTGRGHSLRDFVELEADIKLRLTPYTPDGDLPEVAALERALLNGGALTGLLLPTPEVARNPALLKAFQVIAALRHLAYLTTGITDSGEYLHALLYETVFMATLNRLRDAVKQRALLSAALIVDRLTRRSGLLARRGYLPRLNADTLHGKSTAQVKAHLNNLQTHLKACYYSADLQQKLYTDTNTLNGDPQPVPEAVQAGLAHIHQEGKRIQRIYQKLN